MKSAEKFSIKRGDCLLTEEPFAFVLKSKYRLQRCENCLELTKVQKCSNCQYVCYCGKECQRISWFLHKYECPMLKKVFPRIVPDAARMLCKLIIRLNHGGELTRGYYTKSCSRRFRDLMSHYSEIKNDHKRMEHCEALYEVLGQMMGDLDLLPNKAEFLSVYGKLVTNGFNILDPEMNSLATGVYLGVSVTDHSCNPNAVATFEGTTLKIHAIDDIEIFDWSKIFISYVDLLSTVEERRLNLKENYYFLCTCSRCINEKNSKEENAAVCPNKRCSNAISITGTECPSCKTGITPKYRTKFNEIVELTKIKLDEMRDIAFLDVCKLCLTMQDNILHNLNIWHIKTLDAAFEAAIEVGNWSDALEYGKRLLPGFTKYHGAWNPLLGLLYMKMGKIQLLQMEIKEAQSNLKKAQQILQVTHGHKHSLLKCQLSPLLLQAQLESQSF